MTPNTGPLAAAQTLADALFALLCLANHTGVALDAALAAARQRRFRALKRLAPPARMPRARG